MLLGTRSFWSWGRAVQAKCTGGKALTIAKCAGGKALTDICKHPLRYYLHGRMGSVFVSSRFVSRVGLTKVSVCLPWVIEFSPHHV